MQTYALKQSIDSTACPPEKVCASTIKIYSVTGFRYYSN